MIKAIVVDDSKVTRQVMRDILSSDPEIQVLGEATNGREAIEKVLKLKLDIVTMEGLAIGTDIIPIEFDRDHAT